MNPITHALAGWCLSESIPGLGRRERGAIVLASIGADIDGAGAVAEILTRDTAAPLFWWTDYHHVLAHNLVFAMMAATLCGIVASRRRILVGSLGFTAVHLHFLGDVVGARGPDGYGWPILYLYPLRTDVALEWSGQWALNAWPNIVLTIVLLVVTFVLATRRGYSPVGLLSQRADERVVGALVTRLRGAHGGKRSFLWGRERL